MVNKLPGYLFNERVYEGINNVIYRALKESDYSTAIVKTTKAEYPSLEEVIRLRHEYKILKTLADVKGVIKAYDLKNYQNSFALILEDCRGFSFKQITSPENSSMLLMSFLTSAIQLAETLHEVHQKHIIHKDINLQNIILDPETCTVKLIDFSIASQLSRETPIPGNPEHMEGTLAYMSPEATGRMNRALDYRTDFYSLGVTFYEMLAGQLPFTSNDPLELVYCHLGKNPVPLHQLFPEIPQPVSDIVMKLMAKNAEDRYQSALGLKADLETCLNLLYAGDRIANFTLGKLDKSGQFSMPQKLYGRDREVQLLLEAFDRVSTGTTEIVLVSGYSGIGKTSVINEVHKPIVRQRGYFISGKFDQFKQNTPYAALIQALQALIRQLLTETDEKLDIWRTKILAAVTENGQLIIDVIPEVEYIINAQPAVAQLNPTEARNRFHRVFQQFINVFAQPEHPLVLFLDDLQWADGASLKLIENVACDPDSKYLLILGAYRDNEVNATHPLMTTIERIKSYPIVVSRIVLDALEFSHVSELIGDALGASLTLTEAQTDLDAGAKSLEKQLKLLTLLVYNKTQGNPFFIAQLLQSLYANKLLEFDYSTGYWQWNIREIQAIEIGDRSVVELIANNLQKLPAATQKALQLAACIGHQFSLETLAIVSEQSLAMTADALWLALQAGLILPLSQTYKIPLFLEESEQKLWHIDTFKIEYKFLHDRVQQAAYSLILDEQKQKTHLQIGRLLLQKTPLSGVEENIFDIVNQLNVGIDLINLPAEREQLASLNLIAGKRAKVATAYDPAIKYLNTGLSLVSESHWQTDYELMLDLHTEAVEAEYLNTRYYQVAKLTEIVFKQAKSPLDKIKVYETKIQFHIAQNQMLEAIATALEILEMLGVSLREQPNNFNILFNSLSTKFFIKSKRIEELANLPKMTDPEKIAAMRILIIVLVPAFLSTPNLFPLITFKMVNLSLRYGNSPQAAYGYALYGWLLCGALGDIDSGYQFGQLAISLLEQFNAKDLSCKILNIYNAFICHWKEHCKATIPVFTEALQMSLATGNLEYAGYSSINYCHYTFLTGMHLENVCAAQKPHIDLMRKLKQEYAIHSLSTVRQAGLNLLNASDNPCYLVGESFNETEMLPLFQAANVQTSLFMVYFYKSMLSYLFKEYDAAVENAEIAEKYTASIAGFMTFADRNFYHSLALLAQYTQFSHKMNKGKAIVQKQALKIVEANQNKMKEWATHAPENYQHKYDLVEAEKARAMNSGRAEDYYDRAIVAARESGYIQIEALANELAAEFYFARNQTAVAEVYLLQSYYSYIRWGAKSKVKDLESRYPEFFSTILQREEIDISVPIAANSKTTLSSVALDFFAIAKALEKIYLEDDFDKLLNNLMHLFMETAGATKGLLFLPNHSELQLAVIGENDKICLLRSTDNTLLPNFPRSLIDYVARTKQNIVLNDTNARLFADDPYLESNQQKSVLSWAFMHQGKLKGILYLENNLTVGAFSDRCLVVLKLLAAQATMRLAKDTKSATTASR